jgi:hypothetical protein
VLWVLFFTIIIVTHARYQTAVIVLLTTFVEVVQEIRPYLTILAMFALFQTVLRAAVTISVKPVFFNILFMGRIVSAAPYTDVISAQLLETVSVASQILAW